MSGRILGLDIGEKRIGVALSDPEKIIASPLTVIPRDGDKATFKALLQLIQQYQVERIVIGMPLSLDGSQRGQAERVQEFIRHLTQHSVIPVDTWDERLSTVSAEKALVEGGVKRGKRKLLRDTLAATLILQGYLERLRFR